MTTPFDEFLQGYLDAFFWAEMDYSDENTGGDPLEDNYSPDDLAPEALAAIREDCIQFFDTNYSALEYAATEAHSTRQTLASLEDTTDETRPWDHLGHDFYLTRNGHGAGFWDRGRDEVWRALTEASKRFGEQGAYIGDDGAVYVHG